MNIITDIASKLTKSLTTEQKDELLALVDECRELGATAKQMAPLYAVCFCGKPTKLTKKEEAHAKKLAKKLKGDKFFDGISMEL